MDEQVYYFITVMERMEKDKLGWPDAGCQRCWGFYKDKEVALQALYENWTDMEETIYTYAVLEGYTEGISHPTGYEQWFKFDVERKGYFEINKPEVTKHLCGWAFG